MVSCSSRWNHITSETFLPALLKEWDCHWPPYVLMLYFIFGHGQRQWHVFHTRWCDEISVFYADERNTQTLLLPASHCYHFCPRPFYLCLIEYYIRPSLGSTTIYITPIHEDINYWLPLVLASVILFVARLLKEACGLCPMCLLAQKMLRSRWSESSKTKSTLRSLLLQWWRLLKTNGLVQYNNNMK